MPVDAFALFRGLADLGPRPPGNALSREPQRPAMAGELVQKGIGGSVIGLPRIAHDADPTRKEDEELQVAVRGGAVQVPTAQHLRPQHRLEPLPALVGEGAVRQHADAVDHAAEGRQLPVDPLQHPVHRGRVGDVRQLHVNRHPAFPQSADGRFGRVVGRPAPVEDDGPCPAVRQPTGHGAPDAPQTAGHQVGPVLPQPAPRQRRRGHDDLAEVPRRAHEAQRGPRFGQRPPAVDDGLQFPGHQALHHPPQHPSHPRRVGLLENVQLQDQVGHVRTRRRHLVHAQDVAPGHFHEPAAVLQTGQAGVDEAFSRQAVQDHVDTRAIRVVEDLFPERRLAAVVDVFHSQGPEIRLLRCAGGGEDLGSRRLRQLDRRQPHAPGAGVNQHPFARFQPGELVGQRRRHERARHRGEPGHRDSRRRRRHQLFVGDHFRRERAEPQSDHGVADRHGRNLGTHRHHVAAQLPAKIPFLDEAERTEHVPEVEPGGIDRDADFPGLQGTRRQRHDVRFLENASRIRGQRPLRSFRQGQPLHPRSRPDQTRHAPASRAVCDVVLGVGIQQLIEDVGHGGRPAGVQIDHPRLEVRRFPRHRLAKTPQRGAGKLASALPFQDLRAARHEPYALGRRDVAIRHGLRQRERARPHAPHVFGDLRGGGLGPVTVQPHQVHHPVERHVLRQPLQQRSPRLAILRFHGRPENTGPVDLRVLRRLAVRQHHRLVPRRQLGCQAGRHLPAVRRQDPRARRLRHLRRTLRHDDALVRHPVRLGLVRSQDFRSGEAGVAERPAPHRRVRQGVVRAVVVGETPPPVQLSEGQVHPAQAAQVLEGDQVSRRRQQVQAVPQGLRQVPGRVQHVGGDQQVVAVGLEALGDGVLLDIQRTVIDAFIAEARLGFGEEARGDIRVGVVEPSFRQLRQHGGGGRPRARADLQHPQSPPLRQPGHQRLDRVGQHPVRRPRHRRLEIQVGRGGLAAAEQQRQGIGAAAEHVGQGIGRPLEQPDLDQAVRIHLGHPRGECLGIPGHLLRPRIPRCHHYRKAVGGLLQDARPGEHFEHPAEEAAVFLVDVQPLPQLVGIHHLAGPALPPQLVQVRERIGPGPPLQVRQQGAPVLRIHVGAGQVAGERLRARGDGCRTREEVRRQQARRDGGVAPHDLVQQLLHALDRREQRLARGPLHRVPAQHPEQDPVGIVDGQFSAQDLRRLARFRLRGRHVHAHVADDPLRQPPREPQPLPPERQVRGRALGPGQAARGPDDLKATVQHERVDVQPVAAESFREGNLAHRLARPGPDPPERAEGRAEIDPRIGPGPVVVRHLHRRHAVLQAFNIHPGHGLRRRNT